MATSSGLSRWTRYFAIASGLALVPLQVAFMSQVRLRGVAVVGLFGVVLPMVFGMEYLLVPSYVGRTLSTSLLPGVHFVVAYAGAVLLAGEALFELGDTAGVLGVVLWSFGIVIFVGTLSLTVFLEVLAEPERILRSGGYPQRSTRLSQLAIPAAIGYLIVGTVAVLGMKSFVPYLTDATLPMVVHFYGTGFATLLIFALGMRLLTGFFHVAPPKGLSWVVLLTGVVGPGLLATNFYRPPLFLVGAGLELLAVTGYAVVVAFVVYHTDRRRVGLFGITLGALAALVSVSVALFVVFGPGDISFLRVHGLLVLDGFLVLTIVGYAYQFFPVTNRQFRGATERVALATILSLAVGIALQTLGLLSGNETLRRIGALLAMFGAFGYAYLIGRRLSL